MIESLNQVESKPEVKEVSRILQILGEKGIGDPVVAGGWIRHRLTGDRSSKIDLAYVGNKHFIHAQHILKDTLVSLNQDSEQWNIEGMWNVQLEYPEITNSKRNIQLFYVNSIDSVYLAIDGKLHDSTGHGFKDAQNRILRMNDYPNMGFRYSNFKVAYLCLEGCRRIAQFGWTPTTESIDLIRFGIENWNRISSYERYYFIKNKLYGKYTTEELEKVKPIYDKYGWGFVIDEARRYLP